MDVIELQRAESLRGTTRETATTTKGDLPSFDIDTDLDLVTEILSFFTVSVDSVADELLDLRTGGLPWLCRPSSLPRSARPG